MEHASLHATELVALAVLLFVTGFAVLARKLQTPYPIVLLIGGLLIGLIPGTPVVTLDPDLIFLVVLPPLLFSAAWVTSWRGLCQNIVRVAALAIGLVGFTVFGVSQIGPFLFPGFDWRIGLALGAVAATTDAIAATSIAKRVGLPRRIADLLENESLINDATGLLALEFAISIVVSEKTPTPIDGILRLIYLIASGVASGLLIARVVEWFERRINDGPIEVGITILTPYAAYFAAEACHGSGVLAIVAAGLYLGRKSSEYFSPGVRLQAQSVWNSLTFLLNGFVFILIGLQLPSVLAGVREWPALRLTYYGLVFSILLIALRLVWAFPGTWFGYLLRTHVLHQNEKLPGVRQIFIVGWTGMRGVLALAAAMSLPHTLSNGSPFPLRDFIVFLTYSVIVVTLVGQGLTLPALIRRLGLAAPRAHSRHYEARRRMIQAALDRLDEIRRADPQDPAGLYKDLEQRYRHRLTGLGEPGNEAHADRYFRHLDLSRELMEVERRAALHMRDEGVLDDEALREIEYELDLTETRLMLAMDREDPS